LHLSKRITKAGFQGYRITASELQNWLSGKIYDLNGLISTTARSGLWIQEHFPNHGFKAVSSETRGAKPPD
jgi:hypothetical protein